MQHGLPGAGSNGSPGCQALEAAHVATGAGRASDVERHVAHLAREAMRAAIDLAVENNASANASRDSDVHRVLSAARSTSARLAQSGTTGIVFDPDRRVQR